MDTSNASEVSKRALLRHLHKAHEQGRCEPNDAEGMQAFSAGRLNLVLKMVRP
jgi:hypothetical protein